MPGSFVVVALLLASWPLPATAPQLQSSPPAAAPLVRIPDLPPFPSTPEYLGCFHDHDPHASDPASAKGPRLLRFGAPGCSGAWGCGDGGAHLASCVPWPAQLPACQQPKMSRAYCVQLCLAWSPTFVFSATAYANECAPKHDNPGRCRCSAPSAVAKAPNPSRCVRRCVQVLV